MSAKRRRRQGTWHAGRNGALRDEALRRLLRSYAARFKLPGSEVSVTIGDPECVGWDASRRFRNTHVALRVTERLLRGDPGGWFIDGRPILDARPDGILVWAQLEEPPGVRPARGFLLHGRLYEGATREEAQAAAVAERLTRADRELEPDDVAVIYWGWPRQWRDLRRELKL